jgi:broad specificity phosphatase PhoE
MKKLTLLRHAPVVTEYEGCYNGWIDIDIKDEKLSLKLDNDFDAIYSSDLKRCRKTLDALGYREYKVDKNLREIKFKDEVEGKNFDALNPPPSALKDMKSWYEYVCDESVESFRKRVDTFLSKLEGENILICSHGGTIRIILSIIEDRDFYEHFEKKIGYLEVISTSLSSQKQPR